MPSPAPKKMTSSQARSLEGMRSCLTCHLCDGRFDKPATLMACMHSFCRGCIEAYTENNWQCPVQGCGQSVSCKGRSKEFIKGNPIIEDVSSSLAAIENVLATGPDNWWVGREKDAGKDCEGIEGMPEVDFTGGETGSDGDNHNDQDGCNKQQEKQLAAGRSGRKTMSLDQSLFSSGGSAKFNAESPALPPEFSCSPIQWQSSQPALDDDDRQTATASQLDRVLMRSALKGDAESPPSTDSGSGKVKRGMDRNDEQSSSRRKTASSSAKVQRGGARTDGHSPSRKKQRASSFTSKAADQPSHDNKKLSPKRVSFQPQPRVMLLNPSWTLSSEHTRCLRKCASDGFISMLKMQQSDGGCENMDEFDSGFDFDTAEGRESFLALLSSNRTDHCPPAPLSFYAISTEKVAELCFEGPVVPQSFQYYLAVACGMPIVDIGFISSAASMKKRGTLNHQRYPFPCADGGKRTREEEENNHLVIGAANHAWHIPSKARAAALERHSSWLKGEGPHAQSETLLPGTDLLRGRCVLLVGEFDQPNHSKRTAAKRKKQRDSEKKGGGGYFTRGNISLLLQLCGAEVYDIDSAAVSKHAIKKGLAEEQISDIKKATPLGGGTCTLNDALQRVEDGGHSGMIAIVKDNADTKLGKELLHQLAGSDGKCSDIPVVPARWLFDCIGDFSVPEISQYV